MSDYLASSLDGAARDLQSAAKTLSGAAEELREEERSAPKGYTREQLDRDTHIPRVYRDGSPPETARAPFSLAAVPAPTTSIELNEKELLDIRNGGCGSPTAYAKFCSALAIEQGDGGRFHVPDGPA